MIEINLLPEELRAKKRPAVEPTNKSALLENAIYAVPLVLLIVIIIHLYLGVVFLYQGKVLSGLEQAWKKMEPQRAQILALKKELTAESSDARVVQALLMRRVRVAPKLNKLSLNLQPGIWFNSIAFDKKKLIVRASVISLKSDEMDLINAFMGSLKADRDFISDFSNIEIGSVQRKTIGSYDVVDFVLTATLAQKG